MEKFKLAVQKRSQKGSSNVSRMRQTGNIPAVIYGKKTPPVMVLLKDNEFSKVFREAGESSIIELSDGKDLWDVVVKEVQYHPVKPLFQHIDFQMIYMGEKITVNIPIVFVGTPRAIKEKGGIFVENVDEIEIECLPKDLVQEIEIDVTEMADIGDVIHVSDIKLPQGMELVSDPQEVLANIAAPRKDDELMATTEQVLPEGAEEVAEDGEGGEAGAKEEKKEEKKEEDKKEKN